MDELKKVQDWFCSQCDGDWEHNNSIKIYSLDNPGWAVVISLENTVLENSTYDTGLVELSESDWYNIGISSKVFKGIGDETKLIFIIEAFLKLVDQAENLQNQ